MNSDSSRFSRSAIHSQQLIYYSPEARTPSSHGITQPLPSRPESPIHPRANPVTLPRIDTIPKTQGGCSSGQGRTTDYWHGPPHERCPDRMGLDVRHGRNGFDHRLLDGDRSRRHHLPGLGMFGKGDGNAVASDRTHTKSWILIFHFQSLLCAAVIMNVLRRLPLIPCAPSGPLQSCNLRRGSTLKQILHVYCTYPADRIVHLQVYL